jgi:RNA polymerase-binding transcription factor DksA
MQHLLTRAEGTMAAKKSSASKKTSPTNKTESGEAKPAKRSAAKKPAVSASAAPTNEKMTVSKTPKSPFSKKWLDQQRDALLEERRRYVQHAESLQAEADSLARDREPGDTQFDEESGEGDSIAVERDRDLQLSAQARDAVDQIDAAIARWDAGTYGICIVSGEPIPEERLEAIPYADMRVEHKSRGTTWR